MAMTNALLSEQPEEKLIESPEAQKLREELEKCQKKADEYLTGWKRSKADFVNREKDIERQRTDFIIFAVTSTLRDLLPTYEAFMKACAEMPKEVAETPWGKGMAQVKKSFEDFMKKAGVARMDVMGKKFDPMHDEVVGKKKPIDPSTSSGQAQSKKIEPDTIIEEVRVGYTLHGKSFVTPKVIIAE